MAVKYYRTENELFIKLKKNILHIKNIHTFMYKTLFLLKFIRNPFFKLTVSFLLSLIQIVNV